MIAGISHITFLAKSLDRATAFWVNVFDATEVYSSGGETFSLSKEKYFLVGNVWICVMEGDSLSDRTYNHIAFQTQAEEIDGYISRIKKIGAEIKEERSRVEGEGCSVYFYDFDNHLFELHAGNLGERLSCYLGTNNEAR